MDLPQHKSESKPALETHLDLATVIKVPQAVSGEMVLEKLIDRLMRAAIEQAGAERGRHLPDGPYTAAALAESLELGRPLCVRQDTSHFATVAVTTFMTATH